MTQFNIIGTIFGQTGYDSHTRNLANAMFSQVPTRLSVPLIPNWHMQVNDKELEMIKRKPEKDEINIIITSPLYWRLNTSRKRNWAYLVWEGDKVPRCFIEECLNPDIEYILVPSYHTFEAIIKTSMEEAEKSGVKEITNMGIQIFNFDHFKIIDKIKIIPHGVDLNLFYPKEKPNKCIFLANKGLRGPEDRGGIQYLIKAYMEEFNEEDVELILRINPAYGLINMEQLMSAMSIEKKDKYPKITINDKPMEYKDMVKFYNSGTVFVSPSRSDAFNIPCIEAMACGLPVITTNFGGQADYVNETNGWIIGGKLEEVKWDLMYEGISWLTPDIVELKKKLREVYNTKDNLKSKVDNALSTAKQFTWENSAKQLINLI